MKIKKYNENIEMYNVCQDFLSAAIKGMKSGNPENLTPLVELASTIDTYHQDNDSYPGEPGWYSDVTVDAFKMLVFTIISDEESNTYHA